ncbi:hypothetical protein BDW59DRAFT_165149 [Aspergillus cavernicola]|uniref:Zn(2)-C6 fungal-type domain-containing protein n=1 Tax=Aspergillus cavernicola TaxID=176166 RepID=A0ABR4HV67_9EURO
MGNPRSCDQCYARKKQCLAQKASISPPCIRCVRLSLGCSMTRRRKPRGLAPRVKALGQGASMQVWSLTGNVPSQSEPSHQASYCDIAGTPQDSRRGICEEQPWDVRRPIPVGEEFYASKHYFMIGPVFSNGYRDALEYCYSKTPDLLGGFFAAMEHVAHKIRRESILPDPMAPSQKDIINVTQSLQKLNSVEITDIHTALATLILGQDFATFNILIFATGAMLILRHSLYLAKPWYPDMIQLELRQTDQQPVADRVAGLCISLMPALYDLCIVGHQIKSQLPVPHGQVDSIEARVRSWKPDESSLGALKPSEQDLMSMQAQAAMYRSAALLLIHRIRHPLFCEDGTAVSYANDILDERSKVVTRDPALKLQFACFPVLLAVLEVPLRPTELWRNATQFPVCPACVDQMIVFHEYFQKERWDGFRGSLFELTNRGPPLVVVP